MKPSFLLLTTSAVLTLLVASCAMKTGATGKPGTVGPPAPGAPVKQAGEVYPSQSAAPEPLRIVGHPQAQCVPREGNAVFSVVVESQPPGLFSRFTYRWQFCPQLNPKRPVYRDLRESTTNELTLKSVLAEKVGFYRVEITGTEVTGANVTVTSEPAPLIMWEHIDSFLVSGPVVVSQGSKGGSCPGSYYGYAIFIQPAPDCGWVPNGPRPQASNPDNYPIEITSCLTLETKCYPSGVTDPADFDDADAYRFTVYFTRLPLPSQPYQIRLKDFEP
jgi:hypothetical protein